MTAARALAVALSAALALLLAGCGGLPATSPVVEGRRVDERVVDPPPRLVPQSPRPDATQEQIALDFLRAAEDDTETGDTAKQYLAPGSVALWRWSSQDVVVYDSSDDLTVRTVAPDTLEIRARAVAKVTPEGRYVEMPPGTQVAVTFGMTRVNGEWRIELPREGAGLWLQSSAFDRLYVSRNVYYVTTTGRQLVADTRWFLNSARMATTLARAQLDPPPQHLAGALTSGIPANTSLAVNAVPVENGRAQVTLSAHALEADPQERAAMWAQLAATLSQVSAVQTVSLRAGGTDLELPTLGSVVSVYADLGYERTSTPGFDTALLRGTDGRIARIDPRFVPDPSTNNRRPNTKRRDGDPTRIPPVWTRLAMSVDGAEVAGISGDRAALSRWRAEGFVSVPYFATDLTRPAYDSKGYLWVGGKDANGVGTLYVLDAKTWSEEGTPEAITAPWLMDREVIAVAVASDSARILVISSDRDGKDVRLGLAGIVRSPNGAPTSVPEPLRLGQSLTELKTVVWLDDRMFAVIGRRGTEDVLRPWAGPVGEGLIGLRRTASQTAEAMRIAPLPEGTPESLTSVNGLRGLVVVSAGSTVWVRAGSTWGQIGTGTDVLVPGR